MIPNLFSSLTVLGFSIWAIFSIHLFAINNGTLSQFGSIIDDGYFPDGTPLIPFTTDGRYPKVDWQIKAPAAFLWPFGDGLHPDNSMVGTLFAGAWASSWMLIVLESYRACNKWRIISFISVWGIFQFNHSNALITPIWLALQLLTSPSAVKPTAKDIMVAPLHLFVIPVTFVLGFVIPLAPVTLPFSLISIELKQTAMGWYQQWPLWIAVPHYILVKILGLTSFSSKITDKQRLRRLYGRVYMSALAFAGLSHIPVLVLSLTAAFSPSLFNEIQVGMMQPWHLLVPPNPLRADIKAKDMAQGMFWLIQWDYFSGYFSQCVWSFILYRRASLAVRNQFSWGTFLKKAFLYSLIGGPVAVAVGLVWERDEILLSVDSGDSTAAERVPLIKKKPVEAVN